MDKNKLVVPGQSLAHCFAWGFVLVRAVHKWVSKLLFYACTLIIIELSADVATDYQPLMTFMPLASFCT
jgi:hypothetical protein